MLNTRAPVNSKHQIYRHRFSLHGSVVCFCSLGTSIYVYFSLRNGGVEGLGEGVVQRDQPQRQKRVVQY